MLLLLQTANPGTIYGDVWMHIQQTSGLFEAHSEAHALVESDDTFAYIAEVTDIERFTRTKCNILIAQERFFTAYFAFAAQKGFPFQRLFNRK